MGRDELPRSSDISSHGFGLAHAVELARALGRLPSRLIVFAIQGETFDYGESLSEILEDKIGDFEKAVVQELMDLKQEQVVRA